MICIHGQLAAAGSETLIYIHTHTHAHTHTHTHTHTHVSGIICIDGELCAAGSETLNKLPRMHVGKELPMAYEKMHLKVQKGLLPTFVP
jgi:hypothetical protein